MEYMSLGLKVIHVSPGFGWYRVIFPPSSCCVFDLIQEECW